MSVSLPSNEGSTRENECAPKQSANSAPGRLATSDSTGGPMPIMLSPDLLVQIEARDLLDRGPGTIPAAEAIHLLQELLAHSVAVRSAAIAEVHRVRALEVDKHWFVTDEGGYCAACGLPQTNGRHVARRAA